MKTLITKVKEKNGWLSCMSAHPVIYKGKTFKTCEALFQWMRFEGYPDVQQLIFDQKSPMGAKMKARLHREKLGRGIRWDEADTDIPRMKQCLELKLNQHPNLKQLLLETGSSEIIEDCTTHDRESARFWGMVCKNDQWIGENILGKIWMEIRNSLQNNNN